MRPLEYAKTGSSFRPPFRSNTAFFRIAPPRRPRRIARTAAIIVAILAAAAISYYTNRAPQGNDLVMLTQAANAGESGAELQLGLAYREGRLGLATDPALANYWLHRAAMDGNHYASALEGTAVSPSALQRAAGFFSEIGAIFTRSRIARLSADAQAGDAPAQFQLAMRYRDGSWGVNRDDVASRLWLERAAKGGSKPAMTTLARAYELGEYGFPRDPQQSRLWQDRANTIH